MGNVTVAILLLLLLDLAVLCVLLGLIARVRKQTRELSGQVVELTEQDPPVRVDPVFASGKRLITVEVLNPVQLAATQNRLAGVAGAVAPDLIGKIVYEQAAKIMREQLAGQGVEADVRVHVSR